MKKVIAVLIIAFLPIFATAHGDVPDLGVEPGNVPGTSTYIFERIGEWLLVNLFTISTKAKQERYLNLATERVAEMEALLITPNVDEKDLKVAVNRYQSLIGQAEDMAEKIVFLDGHQIAVAEAVENKTWIHEQVLSESLETANSKFSLILHEAIAAARTQNKKSFIFMVEKYTANQDDIDKYGMIVRQQVGFVHSRQLLTVGDKDRAKEIENLLKESLKFVDAGQNAQAYNLLDQAKDILYSVK